MIAEAETLRLTHPATQADMALSALEAGAYPNHCPVCESSAVVLACAMCADCYGSCPCQIRGRIRRAYASPNAGPLSTRWRDACLNGVNFARAKRLADRRAASGKK